MTGPTFLIDVVLKGALILAAAAALTHALGAASAATRHMVWTLALLSVAALPVLKLALPAWAPPGSGTLAGIRATSPEATVRPEGAGPWVPPGTEDPAPGVRDGGTASSGVATPATPSAAGATGSAGKAETAAAPRRDAGGSHTPLRGGSGAERPAGGPISPWAVLGAAWALGCLGLLLRAAAGVSAVRRIARASSSVETGPLAAEVAGLAREAGIRAPRLLIADDEIMPMAWGVLRPAIALPPSALAWPARRREVVLRHEIAHLRRRDPLTQWIGELVRAVHWVNPLAWYAAGRLRDERELACDDEVLSRTARASDYAAQLMAVARALRTAAPAPALPMARPSQLASRIQAVLDRRRNRAPLRRTRVLAGGLLSALLVSPLAAATPAASEDAVAGPSKSAAEPSKSAEATDEAPSLAGKEGSAQTRSAGPTSMDMAAAALLAAAGSPSSGATSACWEGDWEGSRTHNVNDESHRVKWESGRCSLDLRVEGEIRFTSALDGIEYMAPGSRFSLREDEGDTRRELEAVPGRDGAPIYTYRLGGNEAAFEGDARRWFAAIVLQLARNTGFGAEQRVAALVRDGGVDAVLGEIELLGGDWVRSLYFRALIDQTELASADVVRALRLATSSIDSDHYLAEVAGELADAGPLSDAARDALIGTVESLESDHYRAQVMGRALESGAVGPRGLQALLSAAARIGSDHYAAEILVRAARTQQFGPADRDAYIRAALSMESDHYRAQVLSALLETGGEGVAEAVVLALPDAMRSGHYTAEVVTRLAAGGLRGGEAQRAFVQVIAGTDSDHYRAEMLQALLEGSDNDPEQVATVLVAARAIGSDHYLAEVLEGVARRVPLDGALLNAFRETMKGLESESYYGRVSRSLDR